MAVSDPVLAIVAGVVQGIVEWLPVSSQGNLSIVLTGLGSEPETALQLALFLQLGTTLSSTIYYRSDVREALRAAPAWRPAEAFDDRTAELSFVGIATILTGLVGVPLYVLAVDAVSDVAGAVFVAGIGALLVATGVLQLVSQRLGLATKADPSLGDAVLVGALQGFSVLPGVSRSGVTTSALLFRSHDAPSAFRLSFLCSIPAGVGAGVITVLGAGGVPGIPLPVAVLALATSAVVGYASIDALLRIVDRIPFWAVCFGLGGLAIAGGVAVSLL